MDQRVRAVIDLMNARLNRKLTLCEMAMGVGLSTSHLRKLFKRDTGISLGRWLRERRTHRAKELLESSFLSVKEIAAQVGIGDVSHFAKTFKNAYGFTPNEYRTRHHTVSRPGRRTSRGKTRGNRQIG